MKKRVTILLMLMLLTIILSACTGHSEKGIVLKSYEYGIASGNCTVKNETSNDYEDIMLTLTMEENGFTKEITQKIDTLKKGEANSFRVTGVNENTKVWLTSYTYDNTKEFWTSIGIAVMVSVAVVSLIIFVEAVIG